MKEDFISLFYVFQCYSLRPIPVLPFIILSIWVFTIHGRSISQFLDTSAHQALVANRQATCHVRIWLSEKIAAADVAETTFLDFGPRWPPRVDGTNGVAYEVILGEGCGCGGDDQEENASEFHSGAEEGQALAFLDDKG